MTTEFITVVGYTIAVFVSGVAVGKFAERVERFICKKENEGHKNTSKNDRQ